MKDLERKRGYPQKGEKGDQRLYILYIFMGSYKREWEVGNTERRTGDSQREREREKWETQREGGVTPKDDKRETRKRYGKLIERNERVREKRKSDSQRGEKRTPDWEWENKEIPRKQKIKKMIREKRKDSGGSRVSNEVILHVFLLRNEKNYLRIIFKPLSSLELCVLLIFYIHIWI